MEFAENLKYLRNSKQLTQKELAGILGLTANCICEWEKNRSEPSIPTIKKIADLFDVSADYLLGLEDDFGTRTPAPMSFTASPSEKLTEKEKALLEAFKKLLPETQDFILRTAQSLSDKDRSKLLK